MKILGGLLIIASIIMANNTLVSYQTSDFINAWSEKLITNFNKPFANHWQKITDSNHYQAWVQIQDRPFSAQSISLGKTGDKIMAKYAFGVLDNPQYLSINDWLQQYSSDELNQLDQRQLLNIAGRQIYQYRYKASNVATNNQSNFYIPIDDKIYAFVVFAFEGSLEDYETTLVNLIGQTNFEE